MKDNSIKPSVLIVEDNVAMNELLQDILSTEFNTESAFNGQEGLEIAVRLKPDLIISDINMPVMNGDVMFHMLRSKPALKSIPIIFLSSQGDDKLRLRLLREGVQDYIKKPFAVEEVRSRVRNLLQMRQSAVEFERLYQESALAVKLREEVLATVSHDLKNPLTAIRLQTELLSRVSKGASNEAWVEKFVVSSERSSRHMERLINDLLDFEKIQSGSLSLDENEQGVFQLLDNAMKLMQHQAQSKEIKLIVDSDSNLPSVHCDPSRILQVFSNLIGNAIKFSPKESSIHIRAKKFKQEILFEVTDQGPGISKEDLSRIFERYWQAKEAVRLGTGLGLSIVKSIVAAHGGRIWAESIVGVGTAFYFTLPLEHKSTFLQLYS